MSDRTNALLVVLDVDVDVHHPDIDILIGAIELMRGVAGVEINAVNPSDAVAQHRARAHVGEKILNAVHEAIYRIEDGREP